jgi:hypothetical protein
MSLPEPGAALSTAPASPEQPLDTIQRLGQEMEQADQADVLREALKEAYRKGASDVHNYWVKNPGEPPRGDPEFGEAASDYAEAALDILDISARTTKAQE